MLKSASATVTQENQRAQRCWKENRMMPITKYIKVQGLHPGNALLAKHSSSTNRKGIFASCAARRRRTRVDIPPKNNNATMDQWKRLACPRRPTDGVESPRSLRRTAYSIAWCHASGFPFLPILCLVRRLNRRTRSHCSSPSSRNLSLLPSSPPSTCNLRRSWEVSWSAPTVYRRPLGSPWLFPGCQDTWLEANIHRLSSFCRLAL